MILGIVGHAGIEARAGELDNTPDACPSIKLDRTGHGRIFAGVETTVGKVLALLMAAGAAIGTARTLAYVANYDFGLSGQEIRTQAVRAASVIAVLA